MVRHVTAALVVSSLRLVRFFVIIVVLGTMHYQLVSQVFLFFLRDQDQSAVLVLSNKHNILGGLVLRMLIVAVCALPFHGG